MSHGPHLAVAPSTVYTPVGHTFPAPPVALAISLGTSNKAVGGQDGQEACPGVLVLPGAKDCVRAPAAGERRQDMLVSSSVSPRWMHTLALGLLCTNDSQCWICTDPAIAVNVPEDTSSVNTPSSQDGGCVSAGRLFPAPRPVRSMQSSSESTSSKPAGNARSIRAPNFFSRGYPDSPCVSMCRHALFALLFALIYHLTRFLSFPYGAYFPTVVINAATGFR